MLPRKLRSSIPAPAFPRVMFSKTGGSSNGHNKPALSSTAWIDGVRGLAALIVTLNHMLFNEIGNKFHGYHASPDPASNASLFQLPPLRIFWAMHAMVPLFFVISGYCLSLSFIRRRETMITGHDASSSALFDTLSSAVFRRGIRLFAPVLAITLVSQVLLYVGGYEWGWWDNPWALSLDENPDATLGEHLAFLVDYLNGAAEGVITGLCTSAPPGLNPQLWTIPAEFRGSLLVYVCLLGLASVRPAPRCWTLAGIAAALMARGTWDLSTFVGGLLVAEMEQLARRQQHHHHQRTSGGIIIGEKPSASDRPSSSSSSSSQMRRRVTVALLGVIGMYLLCTPAATEEQWFSPCYAVLGRLTPQAWIDNGGIQVVLACWRSVGGIAFVAALSASRALRRPFELPAAQYFGRISFMMYLVHQLIIRTVMRRLRLLIEIFVSWRRDALVTFFTASGTLIVTFWVSEVLVEVLDKRSVALAKRLLERWSER